MLHRDVWRRRIRFKISPIAENVEAQARICPSHPHDEIQGVFRMVEWADCHKLSCLFRGRRVMAFYKAFVDRIWYDNAVLFEQSDIHLNVAKELLPHPFAHEDKLRSIFCY